MRPEGEEVHALADCGRLLLGPGGGARPPSITINQLIRIQCEGRDGYDKRYNNLLRDHVSRSPQYLRYKQVK